MFGALIVAVLASPVVYEGNAMPLRLHLERISKQVGETWAAEPGVRDLTFVIRSTKMDADALRAAIAEAAMAKWSQAGAKWTLLADPVRREEARRKTIEARVKVVRAWQAELLEQYRAPFDAAMAKELARGLRDMDAKAEGRPFEESWQTYRKLEPLMPLHRSLARVLAKVDPYVIAGARELTVLTNRPNRLQRPLPAGSGQEVAAAVAAHNEWVKEWPTAPNATTRWGSDPRYYLDPVRADEVEFRIRFASSRHGGAPAIRGFLVDGQGREIQNATLTLSVSGPVPGLAPSSSVQDDRTFPVSSDVLAAATYLRADFKGTAPQAFKARLRNPDAEDPLALAVGPALLAASRALGTDLVGCLPDMALITVSALKRITPWMTVKQLLEPSSEVRETPGLCLVRPKEMEPPAPRAWLKGAVAELESTGSTSLDRAIELAVALPETGYFPVVQRVFELILPGAGMYASVLQLRDVDILRRIPTAVAASLQAGRAVRLAELPPEAKRLTERMILRADPHEFHTVRSPEDPSAGIRFELDATDLLADDRHGPALMRLGVSRQNQAQIQGDENTPGQTFAADLFAQAVFDHERGKTSYFSAYGDVGAGKYRYAQWEQRSLRVEFGKTASFTRSWSWSRVDLRKPAGRFAELPAEFRNAVEQRLQRLRQAAPPPR